MPSEETEVIRIMGRGDAIVLRDAEPPKVGDTIQVNGHPRRVVGIESMGNRPPWGVILAPLHVSPK